MIAFPAKMQSLFLFLPRRGKENKSKFSVMSGIAAGRIERGDFS
jgi:hypothetical protein